MNFSQHVTSITHKAGHTLYLVITRDSEAVIDNVTIADLLCDHALVLVRVKHPKPLPTRITTITHKQRGLDATSLAAEVSTLASKSIHTDGSPDSIAEKYNFILAAALDQFGPVILRLSPGAHHSRGTTTPSMKQSVEGGRPNAHGGRQTWNPSPDPPP